MKAKPPTHALGLLLLLLLGGNALYAATLEASLDRIRLAQGETVTLTLTAEGDLPGTPDLSPLTRDFNVLEQGQSTRVSIINGRSSSTKQWQIVLVPRHAGTLTVPPLRINNAESQPITLEVLPPDQALNDDRVQPFFLEVEADPHNPYVQSAVRYTVRVFSRVPLQRASLTEPRATNAVLEQLGEDRSYSAYRAGERYDVIERHYAVFPQRSGKIVIEGPSLSAAVPKPAEHRQSLAERFLGHDPFAGFPDFHSMFEEMQPVRAQGREIALDVRPQPPGTTLPWLPAKSLELSESWSPESPEFRVGQPITRTITLTARGLTSAQLPDLNPPDVLGLKVYPDKSTGEDRTAGDDVIATKTIKTALMPTRSGKLTLPETQIAWWDTTRNERRTAQLPAHTIEVLPAPSGTARPSANVTANPIATSRAEHSLPANASPIPETAVETASREAAVASPPSAGWWPWLAGGLGLAWLGTLGLWLWTRRHNGRFGVKGSRKQANRESQRQALRRVQRACEANDLRATRDALLAWSRIRWPEDPPSRLEPLAERLGGEAQAVLERLDRHLYAAANENWDGLGTWRQLSPLFAPSAARSKPAKMALPRLYPQGT